MIDNNFLSAALFNAFRERLNSIEDEDLANRLLNAISSYRTALLTKNADSAFEVVSSISKSISLDWTASALSLSMDEQSTDWLSRLIAQTEILRAYNEEEASQGDDCYIETGVSNACDYCSKWDSTSVKKGDNLPPFHPGCRCLVKRKKYIKSPDEAPENVQVQRGPKGGLYYDTDSNGEAPQEESGGRERQQQAENVKYFSGTHLPLNKIEPDKELGSKKFDSLRKDQISIGNVRDLPPIDGVSPTRVLVKNNKEDAQVEVIFSNLCSSLGWEYLVPPVYTTDSGLAMRWVDEYSSSSSTVHMVADWNEFPTPNMMRDVARIAIMDALSGNMDRHAGNIMVDPDNDRMWAIDNNGAGQFGIEIPEEWNKRTLNDIVSATVGDIYSHAFERIDNVPPKWQEEISRRGLSEWEAPDLKHRLLMNDYDMKKAINDSRKELMANKESIVNALREQARTATLVGEDPYRKGKKIKLSEYLTRVADNFDRLFE